MYTIKISTIVYIFLLGILRIFSAVFVNKSIEYIIPIYELNSMIQNIL